MPVARAPGRVNLIGDHTDYQDGFCLPVAIDLEVRAEFAARADGRVVARSRGFDDVVTVAADGSADPGGVQPEWGRTVAAVVRVLAQTGRAPVGFDAEIASTLPVGAGLSSSAALEVALMVAAARVANFAIEPVALAQAAQQSEFLASGVPCGVMDQMASVFGVAGHALLLDCRSLAVTPVAIPPTAGVLVVHSGVTRQLEQSAYAERRAACEGAAARLGIATLRDASIESVADDPYARHVVSENTRVLAFVDRLGAGDLTSAGSLMNDSHASLRDDFRVSVPELDELVTRLVEEGAYGARLTGAGFGGCAVALVPANRVNDIAGALSARYRSFAVRACAGAGIDGG